MARKTRQPPADLAELDPVVQQQEEGILVPIMNMDGRSPLGFSVRVAGPDSERAARERENWQTALMARGTVEALTPAERAEFSLNYLVGVTIGWGEGDRIQLDGNILEPTPENFRKLYVRFRFIREQIDLSAGNREDFLAASEKVSSEPSETESTGEES
jgi:hypothetical protein